jgi:hypothetical protein
MGFKWIKQGSKLFLSKPQKAEEKWVKTQIELAARREK